jgi:hypothetical protein
MFPSEVSRKSQRPLKNHTPPVEAVKTFACKVSASFHRQTASAREKYRQMLHQLEGKFLNSSQGEAGLIFAVPNIPPNITPAELASAFNDTLTRLCNESREVQFSSTSLSPSNMDLLDSEHEEHPHAPVTPTASTLDLLLPDLSDSSTAVETQSTPQTLIDDLLCRHGLDELQAPLLPTTSQSPTVKTSGQPFKSKDPFLDVVRSPSFDGLSPYPCFTRPQAAINGAIAGPRACPSVAGNEKALLRKQAGNNLRQVSTDNLVRTSRLMPSPAKCDPLKGPKIFTNPQRHPQCLQPSPLNLHRAVLAVPVSQPMPTKTYVPSIVVSSPYVAYQPDRAPLLPVPPIASSTLMEEITNKLDKALAGINAPEGEGIPYRAASEAFTLDPPLAMLQPIIPLRASSRAGRNVSETIPAKPVSFERRLLDASRLAILAAASEAETSDLRWFHSRGWRECSGRRHR